MRSIGEKKREDAHIEATFVQEVQVADSCSC
jgi:hypothetical protein